VTPVARRRAAARAAALALAVAAALAGGCQCAAGIGDACRTNSDCQPGLYCAATTGVCTMPQTATDGGPDGDGALPSDTGLPADAGFDCGDGVCSASESCAICPADCGACADPCGDGLCAGAPDEDCQSCAVDCGSCCGNGVCQDGLGESCSTCPADCGPCGDPCGNGTCEPGIGETCAACPADCGACCGNGACEPGFGEACDVCVADCGACCPNGACDAASGETCTSCPADCGACPISCPNGTCGAGENCANCPSDCGVCCGNGTCNLAFGETCMSCVADCGACPGGCGDGVVDPGETCDPPAPLSCDASCQIISACAMDVGTIGCGSVVMGTNSMMGSTTMVSSWTGCPGFTGESGPEVAYTFVAPFDESVTFTLSDLGADLDLGVLTGAPECDPSTCVDFSYSGGTTPENVGPLSTLAGQPYYVVIDGFGGGMGAYTLSATCAAPPPPPITGLGSCADPFVIDGSSSFTLVDDRYTCAAGDDSTAPAISDCAGAGVGPDLVYRLDLAFAASVTLDLWDNDGTVAIDTVAYVRDSCGGTGTTTYGCSDDVAGQPRHAHLDLALAAGSYFIWVDESDAVTGLGTWTCGNVELTLSIF